MNVLNEHLRWTFYINILCEPFAGFANVRKCPDPINYYLSKKMKDKNIHCKLRTTQIEKTNVRLCNHLVQISEKPLTHFIIAKRLDKCHIKVRYIWNENCLSKLFPFWNFCSKKLFIKILDLHLPSYYIGCKNYKIYFLKLIFWWM